jgi:ATP synthase protein I
LWLALVWDTRYNLAKLTVLDRVEVAVINEFVAVKKILSAQVLIAILMASGFLLQGGLQSAMSPMLGGLAAFLPNCYFSYRLYRSRNLDAKRMVRSFYTGESIKMLLTAAIFIIIFQMPGINFLTLLVGYLAVLSVFWFALLLWRE